MSSTITKLSPRSKGVVLLSAVILVGFTAYNWVVSPQTTYLRAARLYENMLGDAGKMTTVIKGQMAAKRDEVSKLNDEVAQVQGRFFTAKHASEFFLDLEPIAQQSNCNVDQVTSMPPESISYKSDGGEASDIVIKRSMISFTSTYNGAISFLTKLNSYTQRITITDLTIESDDMIDEHLNCRMTITVYMVDDKEQKENE